MIASMGAFAVADTLVKLSTSFMSTAQVMFYLLGGGLVIFALMAMVQKDRLMDRRALSPVLLIRYFAEIAGMVGMVTALASVPISVVGATDSRSGWRGFILKRKSRLAALVFYYRWLYWCVTHCTTWCNRIRLCRTLGNTCLVCFVDSRCNHTLGSTRYGISQLGNIHNDRLYSVCHWLGFI